MAQVQRRVLFREVNARIRELNKSFGVRAGSYELLCECGRDACVQRIEVPVSVYESALETGRFLVAPGHEDAAGDEVASTGSASQLVAEQPSGRRLLRGFGAGAPQPAAGVRAKTT